MTARTMPDSQRDLILAVSRCSFLPGSGDQDFAREIGALAVRPDARPLSGAQAIRLAGAAWRCRFRLPIHLAPTERPV